MKIMRFALIALSVVLALALFACGTTEETTAAAEADTHAGDESTEAPAARGCKGVIASASVLAVVALAGALLFFRIKRKG